MYRRKKKRPVPEDAAVYANLLILAFFETMLDNLNFLPYYIFIISVAKSGRFRIVPKIRVQPFFLHFYAFVYPNQT